MKTFLLLILVIAVFGALSKATVEIDDSDYSSLRDAMHNALDTENIVERDIDVEKRTVKRSPKCRMWSCRPTSGHRVKCGYRPC